MNFSMSCQQQSLSPGFSPGDHMHRGRERRNVGHKAGLSGRGPYDVHAPESERAQKEADREAVS